MVTTSRLKAHCWALSTTVFLPCLLIRILLRNGLSLNNPNTGPTFLRLYFLDFIYNRPIPTPMFLSRVEKQDRTGGWIAKPDEEEGPDAQVSFVHSNRSNMTM